MPAKVTGCATSGVLLDIKTKVTRIPGIEGRRSRAALQPRQRSLWGYRTKYQILVRKRRLNCRKRTGSCADYKS